MNDLRIKSRELMRRPSAAAILTTAAIRVDDPIEFLGRCTQSCADTIIVAEETDRVVIGRLADFKLSERTLQVHAFSSASKAQARAARTDDGWIVDAVRECDGSESGARKVLAQDGRAMCLGERVGDTTTFAEARIKPYDLPFAGVAPQVDVAFRNYYEETASGRLACIAHRVIGFVAREVK